MQQMDDIKSHVSCILER